MKLPNGFGSVYKLSGQRRNPWIAVKTFGWDLTEDSDQYKQVRKRIGSFPTKRDAVNALVAFNQNPYDLDAKTITFAEVYDKWSDVHFESIVPSAVRTWKAAYNHSSPLHKMRFIDIRVHHLEETIRGADVGSATKSRMKSLYNLLYAYALKHEICDKNYASLCESIKKDRPKIERIPFTLSEIQLLMSELHSTPFADMVLVGIFSGWRPQELAVLQIDNVDLDAMTFTGGLKTDAGKNRLVPIHPLIQDIVRNRYDPNNKTLFSDDNGAALTYDRYRGRFKKVMDKLKLSHKPHDTRHTFITLAKGAHMDEYVIKRIVGHSIDDVTEGIYTHRDLDNLRDEISKIHIAKKECTN